MASIEQRGEGVYRVTVDRGRKRDGSRDRVKRTFRNVTSDRMLKKLISKFEAEVAKPDFKSKSSITVEQFVNEWLEKHVKHNLKQKTYSDYKWSMEKWVLPRIGKIKLDEIDPMDIVDLYDQLHRASRLEKSTREGQLSDTTILHCHRALSSMFNTAIQWRKLTYNPAKMAGTPKATKKEAPHYEKEELALMFEALDTEPLKYQCLSLFGFGTSLRRGEIMGLIWPNIDLEKGELRVKQAAGYTKEAGTYVDLPKNNASIGAVTIPPILLELLKKYKAEWDKRKADLSSRWQGEEDRVFIRWNGKPMGVGRISTWFPEFIRRHNLKPMNFHGLRHSSATYLFNEGASLTDVSTRLRHGDKGTTLNTYIHNMPAQDQKAAGIINQAMQLRPQKEKATNNVNEVSLE